MRYLAIVLVFTACGFAQERDFLTADEVDQIREFVTAINEREVRQQVAKHKRKLAVTQADRAARLAEWRRRREKEIEMQVGGRYSRPRRQED